MAKKTIEQLAKEIYDDYLGTEDEVTLEEAKEMAEMELGAKENVKTYVKSDKSVNRKKTVRERKVDTDKHELMQCVQFGIEEIVQNLQVKTENECSFSYNGCEYSLKIIKHRPKK